MLLPFLTHCPLSMATVNGPQEAIEHANLDRPKAGHLELLLVQILFQDPRWLQFKCYHCIVSLCFPVHCGFSHSLYNHNCDQFYVFVIYLSKQHYNVIYNVNVTWMGPPLPCSYLILLRV
jgi:hypothetical protein